MTVVATVDDEGLPVTSVIDMMDYGEEGLYFLTNVGESFHQRLVARGHLSLSATGGKPTMERTANTLAGKVREASPERLGALMDMDPTCTSSIPARSAERCCAFQAYEGSGNPYEMAAKPPRQTFFGF